MLPAAISGIISHLLSEGVKEVIVYTSPETIGNRKNRGFCFVDFADHKTASDAKRRLQNGRIRPWNCDLVVDWAEGQDEPDEATMSQVLPFLLLHHGG